MNVVKGEGLPDFVMLEKCDENAFYSNLRERFQARQIYTYIGEQVVAVNPFQRVDIYSEATLDSYRNRYMFEVPPHIFALADDTFRCMMQTKNNQCVIITGESGAGKTEASKIFMQFIARVSRGGVGSADNIKAQLLNSNPILEAFGNAKTVRNDNSSRFGKYMEIQFDGAGAPVGGRISQYLLEKSRVVTRSAGERAFHIFYQLLSDTSLHRDLQLTANPSDYYYLNMSGCFRVQGMDDAEGFREVQAAMNGMRWSAADKANVWRILAAILHIGNITYQEDNSDPNCDMVKIADLGPVRKVAAVLDIPAEILVACLTNRSINTGAGRRGSNITVPLNMLQAIQTRDALAKGMYSRLFDWVINRVNQAIVVTGGAHPEMAIGVLDIYGFEIFDVNSFEQFCINFCNEKLQKLFIELVLKQEQEEYVREGIEWKKIDYFNNQPICDLVEAKPIGLVALLDEACLMGNSTSESLLQKFEQNLGDHPHFVSFAKSKDRTIGLGRFRIKHYAGDVTYDVEEFMFKNLDTFYVDLMTALQSSSNKLICEIFPRENEAAGRKKKRPVTAGTQFVTAVSELVVALNSCQPHYIRCIKANDERRAFTLDESRVRHQVLYLNLVETVRVRRAGFCNRQPYKRFLARYKMVADRTWPVWRGSDKEGAQIVLDAMRIKKGTYEMGKTQLFTRNPAELCIYEEVRAQHMDKVALMMQKVVRGYLTRQWFKRELERLRAERDKRADLIKFKKAVKRIQKWWKRQMVLRREAVKRIQIAWINAKRREYFTALNKTFKDVAKDNATKYGGRFGKGRAFAKPWKRWASADAYVQAIWLVWWGRSKVLSLTGEEQDLMRQKILAKDIFSGHKAWDCSRTYKADYLNVNSNETRLEYEQACRLLFQTYGDTSILYADNVNKINPKGKSQLRTLIVTESNIYKYDPKEYKIKKKGIPLSKVTSISVSPYVDSFVVIHCKEPERDLVLDVGLSGEERVSEICTTLIQALDERGIVVKVEFEENVRYNNSREEDPKQPGFLKKPGVECVIRFEVNPKPKEGDRTCIFKKGKNNIMTVLYVQ